VLDCLREASAPFSPTDIVAEFAETLGRYRVRSITGDRYAGQWPREAFGKHGITYIPAPLPKSDLYVSLLPLINSGQAELLDHERLRNQLVGLERRTARGGRDTIDHPPGGHDDVANAVAGCLAAMSRPTTRVSLCPPLFVRPGDYRDISEMMADAKRGVNGP
jgi:hypothetical protein